jgi:hypothetical protein
VDRVGLDLQLLIILFYVRLHLPTYTALVYTYLPKLRSSAFHQFIDSRSPISLPIFELTASRKAAYALSTHYRESVNKQSHAVGESAVKIT